MWLAVLGCLLPNMRSCDMWFYIPLLLPQVEAERRRSGSSRGTRGEDSGDSGGARLSARNLERLKAAAAAEDVRLERRSDTKGACLGAQSQL